jgi:hypothetical protein
MVVDGIYRTGDLVEASVLSMHGLVPAMELKRDSRVMFVFRIDEDTDPEWLDGLISDIRSLHCRVEPKRFAREMRHVRTQMLDFSQPDRRRV